MLNVEHPRPRFGRIAAATKYAAVSRSRLYQWALAHPGLLRKNGSATLCDFDKLDAILNELPNAQLKAPATTENT